MTYDLHGFALRYYLCGLYDHYYSCQVTISNKEKIVPGKYKAEPEFLPWGSWYHGYSFRHFWGNCHALLGEISSHDGIQQLCHHYYLQNGTIDANSTIKRIKRFLGENDRHDN